MLLSMYTEKMKSSIVYKKQTNPQTHQVTEDETWDGFLFLTTIIIFLFKECFKQSYLYKHEEPELYY